jgi:hypothetical protein
VTTTGGSNINRNDILAATEHPHPRRKAEEAK